MGIFKRKCIDMTPKNASFIIDEIQKNMKKLWAADYGMLKTIKHKISRDENLTKNQEKSLMALYERVTDCRRIKWGNSVKP